MPAVANIVLANGESTPVNHTFAPLGQDTKTGIWWFEDQSPRVASSNVLGYPRVGLRTKRGADQSVGSQAKDTIQRVEIVIALPQLETLASGSSGFTPSPTVAYVDRFKGEFLLPSRDNLADRKDALAYAKNIMANALVTDLVQNLTFIY